MKNKLRISKAIVVLLIAVIIVPCMTVAIASSVWATGRRSSGNDLSIGNYEIDLDKSDELSEKVYFATNLSPYNGEFSPVSYSAALDAAEADNGATIADAKVTLTRTNTKVVNYAIALSDTGYNNNIQLRSLVHITAYKVSESTGIATEWTHTPFDANVQLTGSLGNGSETLHVFITAESAVAYGSFKFDLILTSAPDDPDYGPEYKANNLVFYDSFENYTDNWQITQGIGVNTSVVQGDSFVTVTKTPANPHGFITYKSAATFPVGAFTYSFRARLNSESVADFSIRSEPYFIKVILTRGDISSQGTVQNGYGKSPGKVFELDTSVWHDYQVVVNSPNYTYDVYVDGDLAWSGAAGENTGTNKTNLIRIGGDNATSQTGGGVADLDIDYFKLETGARTGAVKLLSGVFKDEDGQKISEIDGTTGDIYAYLVLENTFGTAQDIMLKMELIDDGVVIDTVSENISIKNGEIKEITLTMDNIVGDRSNLKMKVTLSTGIATIFGGIAL